MRRRAYRDEHQLALGLGARFLVRARELHVPVRGLVTCPARLSPALHALLRRQNAPRLELDGRAYEELLGDSPASPIATLFEQRWHRLPRGGRALWLAVGAIRSPGNLGTILRTGAAVGARGVILLGSEPDPFHPTCVRASMGAIYSLQFVRSDAGHLRRWARRDRARVVGLSGDARLDFRRANYRGSTVLLFGAERGGLTEAERRACKTLVRIPMTGEVDSLNVASAVAVASYEAQRQRAIP